MGRCEWRQSIWAAVLEAVVVACQAVAAAGRILRSDMDCSSDQTLGTVHSLNSASPVLTSGQGYQEIRENSSHHQLPR